MERTPLNNGDKYYKTVNNVYSKFVFVYSKECAK